MILLSLKEAHDWKMRRWAGERDDMRRSQINLTPVRPPGRALGIFSTIFPKWYLCWNTSHSTDHWSLSIAKTGLRCWIWDGTSIMSSLSTSSLSAGVHSHLDTTSKCFRRSDSILQWQSVHSIQRPPTCVQVARSAPSPSILSLTSLAFSKIMTCTLQSERYCQSAANEAFAASRTPIEGWLLMDKSRFMLPFPVKLMGSTALVGGSHYRVILFSSKHV